MKYSYFFFIIFYMDKSNYVWWRDKKILGMILLSIISSMMVFNFLEVPFVSSIPRYTVGMMMGFYSPIFYAYFIYVSLVMIFGESIRLPKWVKLNNATYWIVGISIIFIGTSLFYYQSKTSFTDIGAKPWRTFNTWFNDFQDSKSAWAPKNTNGGVIGVFLYSLFASMSSGIGAIIISCLALGVSISIILTGSFFGLYKTMISRKKVDTKQKEIRAEKEINIEQYKDMAKTADNADDIDEEENFKNNDEETSLPFEDPYQSKK